MSMLIRQLDGFHPHKIRKLRANSNSNSKLELDVVGNSTRGYSSLPPNSTGIFWTRPWTELVCRRQTDSRIRCGQNPSFMYFLAICLFTVIGFRPFLGHLRYDPINPVKMSVRPSVRTYVRPSVRTYVCTSTIKLDPATNQIVEFVRVDETFTMIWLSRSSEVRVKVRSPIETILCH